jgi:hypothetical protein
MFGADGGKFGGPSKQHAQKYIQIQEQLNIIQIQEQLLTLLPQQYGQQAEDMVC